MLLNQKICKPVRILVHQTHLYKPESLYVLVLLTLCLYLKPAYIHVYNYFNVFIYILGDKRKRILNAFTLRRSIRYHLTIISPSSHHRPFMHVYLLLNFHFQSQDLVPVVITHTHTQCIRYIIWAMKGRQLLMLTHKEADWYYLTITPWYMYI